MLSRIPARWLVLGLMFLAVASLTGCYHPHWHHW